SASGGFPHLLITDHYGKMLYSESGGGESDIKRHLEAVGKLRASIPGALPKPTDTTLAMRTSTPGVEQPKAVATDLSPRENPAASAAQTVVVPPKSETPIVQANPPAQEIRSTTP